MKKRILCFALALSMALGSMTTDFGALSVYAEQINPEDENNQNEEGNLNPENLDEEGNDGIIIGDDKYVDSGIKMTVNVSVDYKDSNYVPVRKLRPTVSKLKDMFSVKFGPIGDEGRTEFDRTEYEVKIISGSDNNSDKVTYQFTLPVYILEGSDSIDWKPGDPTKATRYYLPDRYYSVELNNSNTSIWRGYTPDTTPVPLTYSRDANEPKWSVDNASLSCTPKDFKDASFNVIWIYKESSEAPVNNTDAVKLYHLYKKNADGSFVEVTDCDSPIITPNSSNTIWTVKYENLPVGENYYLKQDKHERYVRFDEYAIENGEEVSKGDTNVKTAITNTFQKVFTVNVEWHDRDVNQEINQSRPSQDTIRTLLKLYKENNSNEISDVYLSEPVIHDNIYTYTITGDNLPAYDGTLNETIHYYIQIPKAADGKSEFPVKDGFAADDGALNPRYVFAYNNEPHSTVNNLCVDNGMIMATLKADTTYTSTKRWMFQSDDEIAVDRFKALQGKVTLYLFRYSSNHPDMFSAVTDSQGTQYKYTLKIDKDNPNNSDGVNTPFIFDAQVLGINGGVFDEYDERGYRYTYFLKEVMPDGYKYRQEVYYKDENGNFVSKKTSEDLDSEEYVLKDNQIRNIPTEKKDMNAEITWKAGDKSDYRKSKVYLTLQHSEDNGVTWEDVNTQIAADFSTVTTTRNVVFPEVEQYTADGNRFKFRVVEKRVDYIDGTRKDVIDVEDNYSYFTMNGKDYRVTGGTEYINDKFSLFNTLTGYANITIVKKWTGSWKDIKPGLTFTVSQKNVSTGDSKQYMTVSAPEAPDAEGNTQYTVRLVNGEYARVGDIVVGPDGVGINYEALDKTDYLQYTFNKITVPCYDENGRRYIYTVRESAISNPGDYINSGNYYRTDYGESVDKESGDTVATANNITTVPGDVMLLKFQKDWKAGDYQALMQEVVYNVVAVRVSENNQIEVFANLGKENPDKYSVSLNTTNNWYRERYVSEIVGDLRKAVIAKYPDEEKHLSDIGDKGLKSDETSSVYTWGIIEKSIGGKNTKAFDAMMAEIGTDKSIPWELLKDSYLDAYHVEDGHYYPRYEIEIKENPGTDLSFNITNTIKGYTTVEVAAAWKDGVNGNNTRKEGLYVELYRDSGVGVPQETLLVNGKSWLTRNVENYGGDSDPDNKLVFDEDLDHNPLPIFNAEGYPYDYFVKQYLMERTDTVDASKKQIVVDGNRYNLIEILENETEESENEDHYIGAVTKPVDKQTESIKRVKGQDELIQQQFIQLTNTIKGTQRDAQIYILWNDQDTKDSRPNPSFAIYRKTKNSTGEDVYERYTHQYSTYMKTVDNNPYYQEVIFSGLDKYDENGNMYEYYISETLVNSKSMYSSPLMHTTPAESVVINGDKVRENGVEQPYTFMTIDENNPLYQDVINEPNKLFTTTEIDPDTESPIKLHLAKEGSFVTNSLQGYINVVGTKQWLYPDRSEMKVSVKELPDANIYLFRESEYDKSHESPLRSNSEGSDAASKIDASISDIESKKVAKTSLNSDKKSYDFKENGELIRFEKYDSHGSLYNYDILERIMSNGDEPVEGFIPSIDDFIMTGTVLSYDLSNTYNDGSNGTNQRSITVNKEWTGIDPSKFGEKGPRAKFLLYRGEYLKSEIGEDGFPMNPQKLILKDSRSEAVGTSGALYKVGEMILKANAAGKSEIGKWTTYNDGSTKGEGHTWPIYAPNGKEYVYYLCEDLSYSPSYTPQAPSPSEESVVRLLDKSISDKNYAIYELGNSKLEPQKSVTESSNQTSVSIENAYKDANTNIVSSITGIKEWKDDIVDYRPLLPKAEGIVAGQSTTDDIILTLKRTASAQSGAGNEYNSSSSEDSLYGSHTYSSDEIEVSWSIDEKGVYTYTISPKSGATFPQYAPNGMPFIYTVTESMKSETAISKNYKITDSTAKGNGNGFTGDNRVINMGSDHIANTLVGSIRVNKKWGDNYNQYQIRELAVKVELWRIKLSDINGTKENNIDNWEEISPDEDKIISADTGFKYQMDELPVCSPDNSNYKYVFLETGIQKGIDESGKAVFYDLYSSTDGDPGKRDRITDLTAALKEQSGEDPTRDFNSYKISIPWARELSINNGVNNPIECTVNNNLAQVVDLKVTKTWSDWTNMSDPYSYRPDSITVAILYRAEGDLSDTINIANDAATGWNFLRNASTGDVVKKVVAKNSEGNYEYTFKELPKKRVINEVSTNLVYKAVELDGDTILSENSSEASDPSMLMDSYAVAYSSGSESETSEKVTYTASITNTLVKHPAVTITKVRASEDTSEVKIQLYSDNFEGGDGAANPEEDDLITVGEEKALAGNTITIDDLPKYNKDQKVIKYYYKEIKNESVNTHPVYYKDGTQVGEGYSYFCPISDDSETLYVVNISLVNASVQKCWDYDGDKNADDISKDIYDTTPDSVLAELERSQKDNPSWNKVKEKDIYASEAVVDGTKVGNNENDVAIVLTKDKGWESAATNLPKYYIDVNEGTKLPELHEYKYRFVEANMKYANKTVTATGTDSTKSCGTFNISETTGFDTASNTYTTNIKNELITNTLTVNKKWVDDIESNRPSEVSVKLNFLNNNANPEDKDSCYKADNVITITSNSSGAWTTTVSGLPAKDIYGNPVQYQVSEGIVQGYQKAEVVIIDAAAGTDNADVNNVSINLTLKKTDETGSNKLNGGEFKLTDQGNDAPYFSNTTDNNSKSQIYAVTADGTIDIKGQLLAGHSYILSENKAPEGYVSMTGNIAAINVNADGKITVTPVNDYVVVTDENNNGTNVVVTTKNKKSRIQIRKVARRNGESKDISLTGASLKITKKGSDGNDEIVAEWTTDPGTASNAKGECTDGVFTLNEGLLSEGIVYKLEEVSVPTNTLKTPIYKKAEPIYFEITGEAAASYIEKNTQIKIVNADGTAYSGTPAITIGYDDTKKSYFFEMRDVDDFHVNVKLKKLDTSVYDYELNASHTPARGSNALKDVEFDLYKLNASGEYVKVNKECKTNENGYLTDGNTIVTNTIVITERGTYKLKEVKKAGYIYGNGASLYESKPFTVDDEDCGKIIAPDGDDSAKAVVVDASESNINVYNNRKSGTITITKQDKGTNEKLSGIKFALYYKESEETTGGFIAATVASLVQLLTDAFNFLTGHKYDYYSLADQGETAAGELTIENLPWGEYYLLELERDTYPEYKLSEAELKKEYKFTINAANADEPIKLIDSADNIITNEKISFTFEKYGYKTAANDKAKAELISGGEYRIYTANNVECKFYLSDTATEKVNSFTADKDKGVIIYGLSGGNSNDGVEYYIKEVTSPVGYFKASNYIRFKLNRAGELTAVEGNGSDVVIDNTTATIKLYDKPIILTLTKKSAVQTEDEKAKKFANVQYKLTPYSASDHLKSGAAEATYLTDSNSQIIIDELVAGNNYKLVETLPPGGYKCNPSVYKIAVNGEGLIVVTNDDTTVSDDKFVEPLGSAAVEITAYDERLDYKFIKVSSEGDYLAGTEFTLKDVTETISDKPYWADNLDDAFRTRTFTTDANGEVSLNGVLITGHVYELSESASTKGYAARSGGLIRLRATTENGIKAEKLDEADNTIIIDDDTSTATISNKKTKIVIDKVDQDINPLTGSNLVLEVNESGTWKVCDSSLFSWPGKDSIVPTAAAIGLSENTLYRISETVIPNGYYCKDYVYFKLKAVDCEKYNKFNSVVVICNADGNEIDSDVPYARVTTEPDADDPEIINNHLKIINAQIVMPVSLKKVRNSDSTPIEGVEITIEGTLADNTSVTKYGITKADGLLYEKGTDAFIMLSEGRYTFKETKVPSNIYMPVTESTFTLTKADYGKYQDNPSGVRVMNMESDSDKRVANPDDFAVLINETFSAAVSITKYDTKAYKEDDSAAKPDILAKSETLKGAQFYLYKYNANTSMYERIEEDKVFESDSNGIVTATIIEKGKYRFVEQSAAGYVIKNKDSFTDASDSIYSQVVDFEVTNADHNKNIVPANDKILNIRKTGTVCIKKTDEESKPLDGAKFVLYKKNGASYNFFGKLGQGILQFITGTDYSYNNWAEFNAGAIEENNGVLCDDSSAGRAGELKLSNLEWGDYKLVEVSAPTGYHLNKADNDNVLNTYTFTVDANSVETDGSNISNDNIIVVDNTIVNKLTKVTVKKFGVEDMESKSNPVPLSGGKFEILDSKGEVIKEFAIPDSGEITFNGLEQGTKGAPKEYILREVIAPNGYEVGTDIRFKIDECGSLIKAQDYKNAVFDEKIDGSISMYDKEFDLSIQKTDTQHNIDGDRYALKGAKFSLKPKKGSVFPGDLTEPIELETDESGICSLVGVLKENNDYELTEIKAPYGYNIDNNTYNIHFNSNGTISVDESAKPVITTSNNGKRIFFADEHIKDNTVIRTKIENETTANSSDNKTVSLGGKVSIVTPAQLEESGISNVDFEENSLIVIWKPDENWVYGNDFSIEYSDYPGGDDSNKRVIRVENYIDKNGNLITDSDNKCYASLKERYSKFSIRMQDDRIYLELNNDNSIAGMPYENVVKVRFIPTIAVENTTEGDTSGKVKVEGGTYNAKSDGVKPQDGNDRYAHYIVYGNADNGYIVDLDNLTIGNVGTLHDSVSKNLDAIKLKLDGNLRFKETIMYSGLQESKTEEMTRMLRLTSDPNDPDSIEYSIEGHVEILSKNKFNEPTSVKIEIDNINGAIKLPIDAGISFIKGTEEKEPEDTPTSGESHGENIIPVIPLQKPVVTNNMNANRIPKTYDDTPVVLVGVVGFVLIALALVMLALMRRRKDEENA